MYHKVVEDYAIFRGTLLWMVIEQYHNMARFKFLNESSNIIAKAATNLFMVYDIFALPAECINIGSQVFYVERGTVSREDVLAEYTEFLTNESALAITMIDCYHTFELIIKNCIICSPYRTLYSSL